jgi:hypothetical protein
MTTPATFLEYSGSEHRYFADGRELPSVTQILDAAGMVSPFCKDEEARSRGSQVHEFCAIDDVTPLDLRKVPASLRGYLKAWRRYRIDTGFMPTLIEHRVDSLAVGYSGRFDRLGTMPGQTILTLLDIKTSKTGTIADYVRLQLAAYAMAYQDTTVFDRKTVSLMPNGRYNTKTYGFSSHFSDRAEWLEILRNYKEKNNGHS